MPESGFEGLRGFERCEGSKGARVRKVRGCEGGKGAGGRRGRGEKGGGGERCEVRKVRGAKGARCEKVRGCGKCGRSDRCRSVRLQPDGGTRKNRIAGRRAARHSADMMSTAADPWI